MKTVLQTNSATVVFTPGTGGIGKLNFSNYAALNNFSINRLMAVVNQTRNTLIYAEAQAEFGLTNWNATTKELILASDTSTHQATDNIQIIYDTPAMPIIPAEEYFDPVNKSRVSQAQALIDTDFEYSIQSTKWETALLLNNRPSAFYEPSTPIASNLITAVNTATNSRTVTVLCSNTTGITVGTPIFVQDTINYRVNGWWLVESVAADVNFTFTVTERSPASENVYDPTRTLLFLGNFYTGAAIPLANTNGFNYSTTSDPITCQTAYAHGLTPGDAIYVVGTTASTNAPNGSWIVNSTHNVATFTFTPINKPTGTIGYRPGTDLGAEAVNLYPRPTGLVIHRAFDGGVQISTGGGAPNMQMIRQTRKYFRYQSGKGIQFSTGSVLKPSLNIESLSASGITAGATISAVCKVPHGLQPGTSIDVRNTGDAAFNGSDLEILSVPNPLTLTYSAQGTPASTNISSLNLTVQPASMWNSFVRLGMFDQQNGMFFEYDGRYLWAVRRNSTTQLTGTVNVVLSSNVVTGNGTRFSQQLVPGDFICIKGMSYKVSSITNNQNLFIIPEYKGPTYNNLVCSKTIDTKIRQDQWNIDKLDGTGPSGYVLDPTRMQMFYIDYSWYGAGFIRWGVRGTGGNVIYCHKMPNNNINIEAYLRSGNLPARYEENTFGPTTLLTASIPSTDTTLLNVQDTSQFPLSGIIKVTAAGNTTSSPIEIIRYNGKTDTTLRRLTRGVPGGAPGPVTFTYSAAAPVSVELIGTVGPTASAAVPSAQSISHWGSSVLMDGQFDRDSQFVFSEGTNTSITINNGVENVVLAIRLAPSVDSGRIGLLGVRELINRMQIQLRSMDTISTGSFRVSLYLNSRVSGAVSFTDVGGSSLAQVAKPPAGRTITGGESIYSFFCNPGQSTGGATPVINPQYTFQDLGFVRELGNSILGGGRSLLAPQTSTINMFPDGPDILYIAARNIGSGNANINARISWIESQA